MESVILIPGAVTKANDIAMPDDAPPIQGIASVIHIVLAGASPPTIAKTKITAVTLVDASTFQLDNVDTTTSSILEVFYNTTGDLLKVS